MFKNVFSNGMQLSVGEETFAFPSLREFDFALSGRTGLPSSKLAALLELPDEALLAEAEGIRAVEQRFTHVLSRSVEMEDITSIGVFLRELDPAQVSQDYDWRSIIAGVKRWGQERDDYKKVALVKYMQYLATRQEVVMAIYASREAQRSGAARAARSDAASADSKFKETLLFDLAASGPAEKKRVPGLARMPKGETVDIPADAELSVPLMLGKHRFTLRVDGDIHLIDERGEDTVLRVGKSVVGRDLSADVVVDSSYRDISRKHLIIEATGDQGLRLTDISSLGTFVPPEFLDRTGF